MVQRGNFAIILLAACLIVPFGRADGAKLRFVRENIDVSVLMPDTIRVRGEYFFTASDSIVTMKLFYPFPIDSHSLYPHAISVEKGPSREKASFDRGDRGILFSVSAKRGDTSCVKVVYEQRVTTNSGRYILTTTKNWGQPLINSRYTVSTPSNVILDFLSYECDSVAVRGEARVYSFYKKRFMPERDLIFVWRKNSVAR